jgi:hypothetical protein
MGLISAGEHAALDRYVGYFKPYATSHDDLDTDTALQEEARLAGVAVARAVADLRAGRLVISDRDLPHPRQK